MSEPGRTSFADDSSLYGGRILSLANEMRRGAYRFRVCDGKTAVGPSVPAGHLSGRIEAINPAGGHCTGYLPIMRA